eukprot:m.20159 g.20159  ORF g.20159 m.20159 type:complete len:542 (+) comp5535_c0_seq1:183-1808(+)
MHRSGSSYRAMPVLLRYYLPLVLLVSACGTLTWQHINVSDGDDETVVGLLERRAQVPNTKSMQQAAETTPKKYHAVGFKPLVASTSTRLSSSKVSSKATTRATTERTTVQRKLTTAVVSGPSENRTTPLATTEKKTEEVVAPISTRFESSVPSKTDTAKTPKVTDKSTRPTSTRAAQSTATPQVAAKRNISVPTSNISKSTDLETNWINIVLVSGQLPKPDPKQEMGQELLISWAQGLKRIKPRLAMYFRSLSNVVRKAKSNLKGRKVRLFVVGNAAGRTTVKSVLTAEKAKLGSNWSITTVKFIPLTSAKIVNLTAPIANSGISEDYKVRLWDFGKVWAMKLLPPSVKQALIVDVDVVFRGGFDTIMDWHDTMRREDPEWLIAGPLELPQAGFSKPPTPWSMRNESTFLNTGVMLVNIDRIASTEFLGKTLPKSVLEFVNTKYFELSDGGMWPPEQWVLNVGLSSGTGKRFKPLPLKWVVDCTSPIGPWSAFDEEAFNEARKRAFIIHYCNNSPDELLTPEEFEAVHVVIPPELMPKAES